MEYIEIEYLTDEKDSIVKYGDFCNKLPFASSQLYNFPIKSAQCLSHGEDVKTILEITLHVKLNDILFEPGDTIGILPQNDTNEVNEIIELLNLKTEADKVIKLSINKNTTKKNASLPSHLPNITTIRHLFENNLDIRAVPKKSYLRMLSKYTNDDIEKQQLNEICENSLKYTNFLADTQYLIQILKKFKSCQPPIERLLEHLPSLKPRLYSVSSSPISDVKTLTFVFSVIEMDNSFKGVCTKWLETSAKKIMEQKDLEIAIPIYFRKTNSFRLPKDESTPIIMIGPGTGVAPFLGFLRHRHLQKKCNSNIRFGSTTLYFGCRYRDRDFLFQEELQTYLGDGTLNEFYVAFSRENKEKTYVQHLILKNCAEFVENLLDRNAVLYVCGDAKNMGKDIKNTVKTCIMKAKGVSENESLEIIKKLLEDSKYVEDLWM